MSTSRLFEPLDIGGLKLSHRIALAPLTRQRASDGYDPVPLMVEYYGQRSSIPGTLLISEATFISAADVGLANAPGIYNKKQIDAWRQITDVVHANGSYIFCQLWALGRAVDPEVARREGLTIRGADTIPLSPTSPTPRRLTIDEIQQKIKDYVTAAENAIAAGFDGVELHGANGFLIDQFLQDVSNQRDDQYGGCIDNRSRFAIEAVKSVSQAIGSKKTAIRLSPWSVYNGMKMNQPIPQFSDVIRKISKYNLAFLHLIEPRVSGSDEVVALASETLDFAYEIWNGPIVVAGGHTPESARRLVDKERPDKNIVVAFGRHFISTPDLAFRIRTDEELSPYNRNSFYTPGPTGYTDYPLSSKFLDQAQLAKSP